MRGSIQAQTPTEFLHEHDFDENGALYFLGSAGKRKMWQNPHASAHVQAFASSVGAGNIEDFVGRNVTNCRTHNEPYSFYGVDLGKDRCLMPTVYTIRNRNSTTHVMMNWTFEGSNDKVDWFELDRRTHMTGRAEEDAMLEDG
jgi:E3 ubiquitin-protein ligase HECTD1